jgi:CENP-B N-terminal DNA-binding domain
MLSRFLRGKGVRCPYPPRPSGSMTKPPKTDEGADAASWDRYRPKPKLCPICKIRDCKVGAKTCRSPECAAEYDRRYSRGHYEKNAAKIIANQKAARGSRATPSIVRYCEACGEKFEAKGRGKGRLNVCSPDCRRRLRNAQQTDRYHADPQAKRDYKNNYYADNYTKPAGTTHCPNPGCRRQYVKHRENQDTCGRPSCHVWKYQTANRGKVNEKKKAKRRGNPVYAAYQKGYREKNPDKFKSYQPKKNAGVQRWRAAKREAEIAAGTYVDRRFKLTEADKVKIIKRRRAGETLKHIAKSFGIHFTTVARICEPR